MFKKLVVVNEPNVYDNEVLKFAKSMKFEETEEVVLACKKGEQQDVDRKSTLKEEENKILQTLESEGLKTSTVDLDQLPIEEINQLIENDDRYDSLIIVGAKQSSLGKRIFDAEFAYELIQMPTKPILVVRMKESENFQFSTVPAEGISKDSHALFPTDFSENAYYAFTYLEKLVEAGLKHVTLMHIQDISKISPYLDYRIIEFNQIDKDRLDGLKQRLEKNGDVKVDIILEMGRPFKEITNIVDEKNVDLLILGRQGKGILRDIFIGSNSNNLTRRVNCSVLLIPMIKK